MGRSSAHSQADWHALADRVDRLAAVTTRGDPAARLVAGVAALEGHALSDTGRSLHRHSSTGMPTREPLIERMRRDGCGVLGIIRFLDFDRLCVFDPSLGDQLLVGVAGRLGAMLPPERLLCHVDRAQIAIWFGKDATEHLAKRELAAIEYALGEPLTIGHHTVVPRISSHLSVIDGQEPADALARALAQLTVTTAGMGVGAGAGLSGADGRESFAFEQDLRLAMTRGELRLCYQPLIDASRSTVFGAEALMRWNSAARGPVSPAVFIPVIEAMGLANEVGTWAIDTAVREASGWRARSLGDLRVAVNISGHQLERDDLPTLIDRTLRRHGHSGEILEIELTESVAMVDDGRAARLFSAIRSLGVAIAIDDFGTGFSSLSTLRKLSFDKIKIDREFVTEVDRRKDSQAICQSIIALARGLGIRVLAEGVERPEEYAWLRQHGCERFQGFYFSRPLEASDFARFVEDHDALAAKLAVDPRAMMRGLSERLTR